MHRAIAASLLLGLALGSAGCLWLPRKGSPVYVDHRAGRYWSGKGVLLRTSVDGSRCKVAVRNRAGVVDSHWVLCKHVHPRDS